MKTDRAVRPGDSEHGRLRVIVFTAGPLNTLNRVFFERLAKDPLVQLCAIIVDGYERPRKPLWYRIFSTIRKEGWPWIWFKLHSVVHSLILRIVLGFFERFHPPVVSEESYDALSRETGIPIHRVPDIHGEQSLTLIQSLRPQLGAILGGRILREAVITIPEGGTLNIHKRKVPEYRGGGPVGYWEILAGESSIGVTIHYALPEVDAGPVLAESTIPIEECDTLESLQIKADIVGAKLYHDTIKKFALGVRQGIPQEKSLKKPYRSPSEFRVWQLQKRLKRNAAKRMPSLQGRHSWAATARVILQYGTLLPWLLYLRKSLRRQHRAPICILYYHVVANYPANHMCLPLEEFVRQVEFLRRYRKVVSLDEAVKRIGSGENEEFGAAITFDDGYRDNTWAIEYLEYFEISAAFFVSIGHVLGGNCFEHDNRLGYKEALPMREEDIRRLASVGFVVGSHGIYHEDFGKIDRAGADKALRESRDLIAQVTGQPPEHFSFPWGLRGSHITEESFALANRHYRYLYSAYGGYNFPSRERRHFLRIGNPVDLLSLALIVDGYTGFRQCLAGNAIGLKTEKLLPYYKSAF